MVGHARERVAHTHVGEEADQCLGHRERIALSRNPMRAVERDAATPPPITMPSMKDMVGFVKHSQLQLRRYSSAKSFAAAAGSAFASATTSRTSEPAENARSDADRMTTQ